MATDMAMGDADVGTHLPTTTDPMPFIAPSTIVLCTHMQPTARAFGAGGALGAGATGAGAAGVGEGAGAGVGGAGSHQAARPSTRSALLPAAKTCGQQPKSSQCRSGSARHSSRESG